MATTNEELLKQQAATGTQPSRTDQINALYDAQKEAQLNELKGAYEQNLSNAQAARDKLPGQYQQSQNDLATQYERNRLNMNRQFSANGINTGAASQAQLSRSNEYLRDFGKLKAAENQAIADADRGINDLTAAYNRNVASAGASVEASRTGALLDEGARQQQQDLNKAQLLAGYGDFSGFAALYGDNVANNMLAIWKAQNPDLAYRTGQMTPQEYYSMTGKMPAGYTGGMSGGGSGFDQNIANTQRELGVPVTGRWDSATQAAWTAKNGGGIVETVTAQPTGPMTASDWNEYFYEISTKENRAAAEKEFSTLVNSGELPEPFRAAAWAGVDAQRGNRG